MPWPKRRRTLCAQSWLETRTEGTKRPSLLTTEDYKNQAPRQTEFDAFSLRGRDAGGASSFVSSSVEEKESASRGRVLQRRGRARVREVEKMPRSMPAEARRPRALETKFVTRNIRPRASLQKLGEDLTFIDGAASINPTYIRQDDTLLHVRTKTLILVLATREGRRAAGRLSSPCIRFKALPAPLTSRNNRPRCPPLKPPEDHTGMARSCGRR